MDAHLLHVVESAATTPAQLFVASLWQGLLLAAAAWLGMEAWPGVTRLAKIAPRTRFLLWMIVFVLTVLLPFSTLVDARAAEGALAPETGFPAPHLSAAWAVVILGAWGAASLLCLARLLGNGWRLRSLARNSVAFPSEALPAELLARLSMKGSGKGSGKATRRVVLRLSNQIDGPIAIGFLRPAIIIPEWLSRKLTAAELNQIVTHELEHLRRRDDWTNLLQKLLRALFPLNPALLWVERRLCREREMACDDAVLAGSITPREYATCLTALAEKRLLRNLQSLAPGAWQRRSELAERVQRILKHKGGLPQLCSWPLVSVFVLAYLLGGVALARCPRIVDFVPSTLPRAVAAAQATPLPSLGEAQVVRVAYRTADPLAESGRAAAVPHNRKQSRRMISAPAAAAHAPRPRVFKARFADEGKASRGTQVVFTVWEISPSLPDLPTFVNEEISSPQFITVPTYNGWIVFQL